MLSFEDWFDREYPANKFATHMMIMRLSLKEVAQKAWDSAYNTGYEDGKDAILSDL